MAKAKLDHEQKIGKEKQNHQLNLTEMQHKTDLEKEKLEATEKLGKL